MSITERLKGVLSLYNDVIATKRLPQYPDQIQKIAAVLKEIDFTKLKNADRIKWDNALQNIEATTTDPDEKIIKVVVEVFSSKRALVTHFLGLDTWMENDEGRNEVGKKMLEYFFDPKKFQYCLDLGGLGLTDVDIPPGLDKLTNVKEMDLSNNRITKVPESVLGLPKLEILILLGNNIQEAPDLPDTKIVLALDPDEQALLNEIGKSKKSLDASRYPRTKKLPDLLLVAIRHFETVELGQRDLGDISEFIIKHPPSKLLSMDNLKLREESLKTISALLDRCGPAERAPFLRALLELLTGMSANRQKSFLEAVKNNRVFLSEIQRFDNFQEKNIFAELLEHIYSSEALSQYFDLSQYGAVLPRLPKRVLSLLLHKKDENGKLILQKLKNYKFAMENGLLDLLDKDQQEKLINGPYEYGLSLFSSATFNELPKKWTDWVKVLLENNRIVPDKREKFLEAVLSLVARFSNYDSFIRCTLVDKPESLIEIHLPEQGEEYEKAISIYLQLYPKENHEPIVNGLRNEPGFLQCLSQSNYPKDVWHRAIELLPYRNLLPGNAAFYCNIIQLLFKPNAQDANIFHHLFAPCIPFLRKLKAEELVTLLNVTATNGYKLIHDFYRIVPLLEQLPKELVATLVPLGLTPEDFQRTKMGENWCFQKDKFDPKYSAEISSEAYLTRSQALSAKLLTLWGSLQFSPPNLNEEGKVPHLFLEVVGQFRMPQDIRNALVDMLNKLQNKTDWLGVPNDPNDRELFYKEMLITFEEVVEALEKTEDVSQVAGTLISIATPAIEGRCGTAYIDELKQKAEYIHPVSVPKDYKSRYQISANKALFAMITHLGARFWSSNVHVLRHLKYVCRLGLSPDVGLLNDDTAKALIRDNFDLERFLKDIGHDFSDQMCDLYFEETMPNTYNPDLSNLQAKYKDEETHLFRSFKIDPKLLEKLASMRTTLRHIPINRVTSASRANLIKVVEEDIRNLLPDLEVVVKAELDAFKANTSRENLDNLNKAITEYADARLRSYIISGVLQLPDNEKMAIAHFKRSLEGIRFFELEMQPLQLKAKDLLEALKVRIALENGLMDLGKNLPDDITYIMQEHGTPSEAIRQERLLQYKIEKLGEDFNYYRKLLYIGKEEKILV